MAEPPAFGVALAHSWPCAQPTPQIAKAIDGARKAAAALGITNGPTYTQVIVSEEGAVVGELAARLGGGHDAELCRAALRVRPQRACDLRRARGARAAEQARAAGARRRARASDSSSRSPGELRAVRGLDEAFAVDGVRGIRVYRRPGTCSARCGSGADRAGAILAVGDSAEDALARADRARSMIRFEVEAARVVA